ncbi:hypothetical protein EST38_g10436 [Candolleomyces aberdarensis]|uniref:Uncharacterized protein n=1 Tax=Candolleomyces aberdarensis TaxID=2316362 RepID=A0A4V1Q2K7_9AGAR|nr:hypothetical protein EST38_g10436 [Candolleomyces aberdarensis]
MDKAAHPLNKALNNFRRPSPAPTPPPASTTPALVQDGTYLEMLSLKFGEGVSKALAQPTGLANPAEVLAGKRPLPAGRGSALGALIATELNAARGTPHLYRAVLRTLHRPLSVLLTNLSSILVPLLASPAFLNPSAPTVSAPTPNATQSHALGIAKFAEELLIAFDQLELGTDNDPRGDGLKPVREGLVSLINKVTTPLVTGIRNELIPLIESLERPAPRATPASKTSSIYHPSITTLQTLVPIYARALARYTSSQVAQSALANLLISVLWKAMVALSHRSDMAPSPPPSPGQGKKRRGSPPSTTPPATPPASRFMLKLPPSRPPSPPAVPVVATAAGDCKALLDLINQLPRPASDGPSRLAGAVEAVDAAFVGLKALSVFLEVLQTVKLDFKSADAMANELLNLTEEIPTLIALPPLLRMYGTRDIPPVSEMSGLSEEEYRRGCLSGFGRAEECATVVGQRVLQRLNVSPEANDVVLRWLNLELELV